MSGRKTRGARLPETLDDKFVEYKESNGMTNSEAVRTLIREGLDRHDQDQADELTDEQADEQAQTPAEVVSKILVDTTLLSARVVVIATLVALIASPAWTPLAWFVAAATALVAIASAVGYAAVVSATDAELPFELPAGETAVEAD
jgi:hypothetical protein